MSKNDIFLSKCLDNTVITMKNNCLFLTILMVKIQIATFNLDSFNLKMIVKYQTNVKLDRKLSSFQVNAKIQNRQWERMREKVI